jgi:hypothetical protein
MVRNSTVSEQDPLACSVDAALNFWVPLIDKLSNCQLFKDDF